jgi:phosphatidylglycerophosphate synthase
MDTRIRQLSGPTLDRAGATLARTGVRAGTLTAVGWLVGVGACVAAAQRWWWPALALWLANRLLDGLDGPVARAVGPTDRGGFVDLVADFTIYGGFVVGVAIGVPGARVACLALLLAYYVSGTAFLVQSSLLEKRRAHGGDRESGDGRSVRFVGGLAEGAETILVYVLLCLFPAEATGIAWAFTVAVAITAVQRVVLGLQVLGDRQPSNRQPSMRQPENDRQPSDRQPENDRQPSDRQPSDRQPGGAT